MLCRADEVNFLSGPGKGVILIKLQNDEDRVLGFVASIGDRDLLTVETSRGAEQTISTAKYEVTGRGGKGRELLQRGQFTRIVPTPPELPLVGVIGAARRPDRLTSRFRRGCVQVSVGYGCGCRRRFGCAVVSPRARAPACSPPRAVLS